MNLVLLQAVRDVWDGLTVLLPNTDAVFRELQMLLSQFLDVLGYLDEIPVCTGYEIDGKVNNRIPDQLHCLRKQNRFWRLCGMEMSTSAESKI